MSRNPLKIALPYARALYDYAVEQDLVNEISAQYNLLKGKELLALNPSDPDRADQSLPSLTAGESLSRYQKTETIGLNKDFSKFLFLLKRRKRYSLLPIIMEQYAIIVNEAAAVRKVQVSTAFPFTTEQQLNLIKKLKELTNSREIVLEVTVDSSLIGGFSIQFNSQVVDFTIKNQLGNLAKKLGCSQGIENWEYWDLSITK